MSLPHVQKSCWLNQQPWDEGLGLLDAQYQSVDSLAKLGVSLDEDLVMLHEPWVCMSFVLLANEFGVLFPRF